ncbi:hypothetical protein Y032_0337g2898 [Ancylostoma ceylanicum]|uniref:Uncharacterized protein n=1 Tax=Ancylostoma ceylanicum TaxID=53326 RepID=A0A016RY96_9BILA|nr:hypothetical protein Y032_0337g2898 [Ancylostoma ceylanicum]
MSASGKTNGLSKKKLVSQPVRQVTRKARCNISCSENSSILRKRKTFPRTFTNKGTAELVQFRTMGRPYSPSQKDGRIARLLHRGETPTREAERACFK